MRRRRRGKRRWLDGEERRWLYGEERAAFILSPDTDWQGLNVRLISQAVTSTGCIVLYSILQDIVMYTAQHCTIFYRT